MSELILKDDITAIGWRTIQNGENVERIVIPDSCVSINEYAFIECIGLKEIIVGEANTAFTSADGVLFSKDKKRIIKYPPAKDGNSYEIPDSVEVIDSCAFCDCSKLSSVKIPESVLRINKYAFTGCSKLKCVDIHKNMEVIEQDAFYGCKGLNTFKMHPECKARIAIPENMYSGGFFGYCGMLFCCCNLKWLFVKDETTNPVENLKWLLSEPARLKGEFFLRDGAKIASSKNKNQIKIIARNVPIQKVPTDEKEAYVKGFIAHAEEYPDAIAKGYYDYLSRNLKKWMPVFVNDTAFLGFMLQHDLIKKTKVDEVMEEIQKTGNAERTTMMMNYIREKFGVGFDEYAVRADAKEKEEERKTHQKEQYEKKKKGLEEKKKDPDTDLKDVWKIEKLGDRCTISNYKGCAESLVLPEKYEGRTIISVERSTNLRKRENDSVKTLVLPESLRQIGAYAFANYLSLEKVVIPDSVEHIYESAFLNCKELKTIVMGKGLTYQISHESFKGCEKLEEIVLPEGITRIGSGAFKNCKELKTVVMFKDLEHIEHEAFMGCEKLEEIVLPEKFNRFRSGVFGRCKSLEKIVIKNKEAISFDASNCFTGASKAKLYVYSSTKLINCPLKSNRIVIVEEE